jgi:hypothetical protein
LSAVSTDEDADEEFLACDSAGARMVTRMKRWSFCTAIEEAKCRRKVENLNEELNFP